MQDGMLVNAGIQALEWKSKPLEQFPPVGGGRGEDQWAEFCHFFVLTRFF